MKLLAKIKKIKIVRKIYFHFKHKKQFGSKFQFINRSKNSEKLCYILAGYKDFVWDNIFSRIKKFVPDDIDVCILSSGVYVEKLKEIADKNNWSYLSTKINNISLAQNIVIDQFKNAKYIYKLDEDIFITENYFTTLMECLKQSKKEGPFIPGVVSPIININGFGHVEILKNYNLISTYSSMFEEVRYSAGSDRMIENNYNTAMFMWGKDKYLPHIDQMNRDFQKNTTNFKACAIRLSIGAILFERSTWENIKYFHVSSKSCNDLGGDEGQLCDYCIRNSRPFIISLNSVVGHLSFGLQNKEMKQFYLNNPSYFEIR